MFINNFIYLLRFCVFIFFWFISFEFLFVWCIYSFSPLIYSLLVWFPYPYWFIYSSTTYLSVCFSFSLSNCYCIYLSVYLSVNLSVCLTAFFSPNLLEHLNDHFFVFFLISFCLILFVRHLLCKLHIMHATLIDADLFHDLAFWNRY